MRRPVAMFAVFAVLYAVARLVEFEVGAVFTDCSLPVLAAMVVALPPGLLPWGVAIGATLSAGINAARGARHVSRRGAGRRPGLPPRARARRRARGVAARRLVAGRAGDRRRAGAYIAADLVISLVFERLAYAKPLAFPRAARHGCTPSICCSPRVGIAMAIAADGRFWAVAIVFLPLALLMRVFANERRARIDQALELSHAYRGTAMLLGDMVESDDAYTGSHSRDVVDLALEVGTRMGLDGDACGISNSAPCSMTSARSPCRKRSSTSPAG